MRHLPHQSLHAPLDKNSIPPGSLQRIETQEAWIQRHQIYTKPALLTVVTDQILDIPRSSRKSEILQKLATHIFAKESKDDNSDNDNNDD